MSSELSVGKHGPGCFSDSWGLWSLICKMGSRVRTSWDSSWGCETQTTARGSTRHPTDPIASLDLGSEREPCLAMPGLRKATKPL